MSIRGVILAGGMSRRMGRNKLELEIDGKPIIKIVIENAKKSKLKDIIIVCGKYDIETDLIKINNPRFEEGMSTSIIKGMENYQGEGVIILLGDMPYVDNEIIDLLIDSFTNTKKNIVVPINKGKKGNPVIIGAKYFKDLLDNTGDKGARNIINENSEDVEWVEINSNAIFLDIDDEESYFQSSKSIMDVE